MHLSLAEPAVLDDFSKEGVQGHGPNIDHHRLSDFVYVFGLLPRLCHLLVGRSLITIVAYTIKFHFWFL